MGSQYIEVIRFREDLARMGISAADIKLFALKKKPSDEQLPVIRTAIQALLLLDPNELEGFCGVRIVQRVQERPHHEDCFRYIFGNVNSDRAQEILKEIATSHSQIESIPNAYAVYLDESNVGKHIGRVTMGGNVISKWGFEGHVYEHKPLYVPLAYGSRVVYFDPMH